MHHCRSNGSIETVYFPYKNDMKKNQELYYLMDFVRYGTLTKTMLANKSWKKRIIGVHVRNYVQDN